MFNKSFKAAKCKTSLKLACSRIKLLKNKKEVQVKQMKRELAKLLESGQDRTAMIRVEHVVVEEKKLSAYDLIEIYCVLTVARLQIIESQKNCPIDLKEAITSLIFASSGCVDVPELMDVRKHFTSKYGKEFVSAAVELRPNCGVARMMIEKLSVKAPDGQTKIQILKSIAKEHNIKWDPSAVSDPTPPEDLLNGPSTFGKASQMYADHPNVQSAFQVPFSHNENRRSGHHYQNSAPTEIGDSMEPNSVSSRPGSENGGREFRPSYSGRQKWNMEFKDAAEAAQAAAEAADQASMAARAAAQLSSRENVTRQYSSGSSYDMYSGSRFEGSRSSSLNSHSSSLEGNSSKSESSDRMSFSRQFSESGFKSSTGEQIDDAHENIGYYAEVGIRKQLSNTSSHSHSRGCSKDSEVLNETSSHDKISLVFDESGSDDDEDVAHKYKEHESVLFFSSPRQNVSHSLFSASSAVDSRSDDVLPVTFDDSDGPSSETEEDMNRSKPVGSAKFEEKFGFSNFPSKFDKSHEVSDNEDSHLYNEQLSRPWLLHEQVKYKFGASELPHTISESDTQLVKESSLPELNLGMLTGGLRNKGYTDRSPSGNDFLSKRAVEDTCRIERSSSPPRVQTSHSFGVGGQQLYNQKAKTRVNRKSKSMSSNAQLDHDSDEEIPRDLGRRNHNMTIQVKNKSSSYFDSDNSESEEYLSKQTPTTKSRSGIGFSRRTKASPHGFNATVSTEGQVTPGHNAERTRTFTELHADSESSYHVGDVEWARKLASKPVSQSLRPLSEEILKSAARDLSPDPRQKVALPSTIISLKTLSLSATESPSKAKQLLSDSRPKVIVPPGSMRSPKTLSLSSTESPSKEKPSHVHPKLPDIDSFTAHFQSLRSNHGQT